MSEFLEFRVFLFMQLLYFEYQTGLLQLVAIVASQRVRTASKYCKNLSYPYQVMNK